MTLTVDQKNLSRVVTTVTVGDATLELRMVEGYAVIDPTRGCGWLVLRWAFMHDIPVGLYEGDEHRFTVTGADDGKMALPLLASGCFRARIDLHPMVCEGAVAALVVAL